MAENRELALVLKLVADQFQAELKKSGGALGEFNSFIKDWKTQLAAVGAALFAVAKSTANFGEEALKGAQKAGQTVETFSALSYAARLADIDQQQLIVGLKSLSQNMVEAARNTGDGEAIFRRLGVAALDTSGKMRPTEQVLLDVADVFFKAADGAGKTEAAVKLFGKAGIDLIPFLNQGRSGLADLMVEAKRLGVVLSTEDAEAANRFNDELKRLQAAMQGVTFQAGKPLIGVLTDFIELFKDLANTGAAQFFFKGLAEQAALLTGFIKELAANFEFLFGKFTFDQLRVEIARIEAETQAKLLLLENPKAGQYVNGTTSGGAASGSGKAQLSVGTDQEKLGKALLEIHLADYRAIDIANKQRTEGADAYYLSLLRQIEMEKIEEEVQERKGKAIVEHTKVEVAIRDGALANERDGLVENLQAWVAYGEQVGASQQFMLDHELDLVRANLAKQTELTTGEAGRLLIAWQNHDEELATSILSRTALTERQRETLMLQTLTNYSQAVKRSSDDFVGGWAEGMRKYIKDTQSGFGLAADMARRSFQTIEQSASKFFFDSMEGRIQRLKDVMSAFSNFAKQIASQLMGQFITKQVAGAFTGAFPSVFGSPGANTNFSGDLFSPLRAAMGGEIQHFAGGGPVLGTGNRDTVKAMLTPGEWVLSRNDVSDIKRGLGGGVQVVVNNYGNNEVQTSAGRGPNGQQLIYVTVREAMKKAFADGQMDKTMASRFKMIPQAGG